MNARTYLRAVELGTVTEEDAASAAARMTRWADDLAGHVEHLAADVDRQHRRETQALAVLRDHLGRLHVELDELTDALTRGESGSGVAS